MHSDQNPYEPPQVAEPPAERGALPYGTLTMLTLIGMAIVAGVAYAAIDVLLRLWDRAVQ